MILTKNNHEYIIDEEDAEKVKRYNWYKDPSNGYWCTFRRIDGVKKKIYLHRYITGNDTSDLVTDHINHDVNDNRKCNLRICTPSLNLRNKRVKQNNKTGYCNIYKDGKRYMLQTRIDGKKKTLGRYDSIVEALKAKCGFWLKLFNLDMRDEIDEAVRELENIECSKKYLMRHED